MSYASYLQMHVEFDRQTKNLLDRGYPKEILEYLSPLKEKFRDLDFPNVDLAEGKLPFIIVVKSDLMATDRAMSLVEKDGKQGITKLFPLTTLDFKTIDSIQIPNNPTYLLINIDRGKETINLPPNQAMKMILEKNRFPLTIDEGIAIVTQFPEFLIKNNCFSLLASRHIGDKRVPAIWINAQKQPNLGWCWDGNPHTWLGSASGSKRFG
jgi:uncharacterized protein DUF5701